MVAATKLYGMFKKVTRYVADEARRMLWLKAGGRCEFRGCNEILYRSVVTQRRVNRAQRAHIYSFSSDGPRGRGPYVRKVGKINSEENLMLVCPSCHLEIDDRKLAQLYTAKQLLEMKAEHEARIERVTGVAPHRKTHIIFYRSRVGPQDPVIEMTDAFGAVFPERYPAEDRAIDLSSNGEDHDGRRDFWKTEAGNLERSFNRWVTPLIKERQARHFSVFAFGDIPLLMRLGVLLGEQVPVEVHQLKKQPTTWARLVSPRGFRFELRRPRGLAGEPVLLLSCSGVIDRRLVAAAVKRRHAVWELTVPRPYNDFMRGPRQLGLFREYARFALAQIRRAHPGKTVHVFAAVPVSCAVEFGRVRMKPDAPWLVYDFNQQRTGYVPVTTLGKPQ